MDFLKNLLFPKKCPKTFELEADLSMENPMLDISEEDIDDFLSQSPESVQKLVTTESMASIASLFNHLDELDQVRKDTEEEATNNYYPKKTDTLGNIELMQEVTVESSVKNSNDELNLEAILNQIPDETIVKSLRQIDRISQELQTTESKEKLENTSAIEESLSKGDERNGLDENKDEQAIETRKNIITQEPTAEMPFTITEIEQILTDLTAEPNASQIRCEEPSLINLGSEEVNISPHHTKDTQTIISEGETMNRDSKIEINTKKEYTKVIELTLSEDEMEDDIDCNKDPCCPEQELNDVIVDNPLTNSLECTTDILRGAEQNRITDQAEEDIDKQPTYTYLTPVSPNRITDYETLSTTKQIADTAATVSNENRTTGIENLTIQDMNRNTVPETVSIPDAVNNAVVKCGVTKGDMNEIISIGSTDDECEAMDTCEVKELDTISCGEIEFFTDKTNDSCNTNNPGTTVKKAKNNNSCTETEDSCDKAYDSDYCGYHSSDFEFISETEAEMDGLIINYNSQKRKSKPAQKSKSTVRTVEIAKEYRPTRYGQNFDLNQPGPSYVHNYTPNACNGSNHVIPQGDAYYRLFEGMHGRNLFRYMENKCVFRTVSSTMHVEYDGLGQNMVQIMRNQPQAVDKEYIEEAKETVRKIREM